MDGVQHLRQSVHDILSTPIGTRVHRRDYGSDIPRLIDRPVNAATIVDIYAAAAKALHRWEPRLKLSRIRLSTAAPGRVELSIEGEYRPDGRAIRLDGLVVG